MKKWKSIKENKKKLLAEKHQNYLYQSDIQYPYQPRLNRNHTGSIDGNLPSFFER